MKPFILPTPAVDKFGKINLTPQELEELINKAYDAGWYDGKLANKPTLPYPYVPCPSWPTWPTITWTCGNDSQNITTDSLSGCTSNWSENK